MSTGLHSLLYTSSAVQPLDEVQLHDLLEVSRKNNNAAHIGGILLYFDGNFLQYLEGEKEDLDSLYSQLLDDSRHHRLFVLHRDSISDRAFPGWTMGYKRMDAADLEQLAAFDLSAESLEQNLPSELPAMVLSMMRVFYRTGHRFATN